MPNVLDNTFFMADIYLCTVLTICRIRKESRFAAGSSDMTSQSENCWSIITLCCLSLREGIRLTEGAVGECDDRIGNCGQLTIHINGSRITA